ncbi:zinc finger MYM-type protein 4 [Boleophthalmus pectinirostris]|uniref:zinc finger MYM-type protein 4 n=2 Tax=Boleophthalmus pectinirostris TaxID=150288 RepID=UPI00242CC096|nr:zinc finger MYM-type protein 4 [Boleophthalmus pectinirostris]XP_055013270.1 zinc finger MYM-type protein 4 [Boleophthalmus pectinirostris]XP_055013271.1 zinc finger MYM-type protein 4 [Boleophthalmus pectinirostris]
MDIGTVDQEEQEAQIKEEENTMDMNISQSPALSNTGSSSPSTLVNGTKEKTLVESESSSPALVQVKDEPLDEEYDRALNSSTTVKDEEESPKNDLQIGAVFSVPPEKPAQPPSGHMSCSRCKKALVKGQTAFQRKGCPSVYCSTSCLTANLKKNDRMCHQCRKVIERPHEMVVCPDSLGVVKNFCSQKCLFSFKKLPTARPSTSASTEALCSMCSRYAASKHEVSLCGILHKLCSDDCFQTFRTTNKLTMSGCVQCGSFFSTKPLLLILSDGNKTLCNQDCLTKYKEKNQSSSFCTMCRSHRLMSEMVENTNPDNSVNLFCSTSCIMAYKVQTVSTSGVRLSCDTCMKITVPSYHLAMSDTSIRNFCSLPCVLSFQEKFKKQPSLSNVFTKLPGAGLAPQVPIAPQPTSTISLPPLPKHLYCRQCESKVTAKPEVLQIEDKMVFFCGQNCLLDFKTSNFLFNVCDYCKVEKVTKEVKRIMSKTCNFCSDGCKLLYRHDLTMSWGKHCHSCSFCHSVSKKVLTAHYGNAEEEFCSDLCRSNYTMLYCHVAKCDFCARKGKLKQSLSLLGDAKHFCDLNCLLQFCIKTTQEQGALKLKPATPVIANVMSLASSAPIQARTKESFTSPLSSTEIRSAVAVKTTNAKPTAPSGPVPPTKILKNKALLCKPLVQNKGVSCKTQTTDSAMQTDKSKPDVLILPVPVPVYVPVPMGMYSQCTPHPLGLPFPLPVPMFLPVAMDNAEKIVETIQEIKEKIPSDPFEAELILMAEMVAEDSEEKTTEKPPGRQSSRTNAPAHDDRTSTYSDDLDTDDLTSFLNNWEQTDVGLRTPSQPFANEKVTPLIDIPVGTPNVQYHDNRTYSPPPMDLEADHTIESLESLSQLRQMAPRAPSPPARHPRKAREKRRGRKPKRYTKSPEPEVPSAPVNTEVTLKSEYGLNAWKQWVHWRRNQPQLQKLRIGSRPFELKEDVLQCTTAELSMSLCFFMSEIKRPNGEPYSPDSLYYLCLGIQKHLFDNGRVENIFMDRFYSRFSADFTKMLGDFKPIVTSSGYVHSRVEESFMWECKQLGAYSPIVLLNTLLFFCCKHFGFRTVEQHRQLSFAHVMRCTKTDPSNNKTTFLRFYPPVPQHVLPQVPPAADTDAPAPKKRKSEDPTEEVLEMPENSENPLRCPVRLYEFYLSKCSESVKQRTNLFYLLPERCCVPNSPLWFSSTPLDDTTMESMLVRILSMRELHPKYNSNHGNDNFDSLDDKPYIPEEEDSE